MRIIRATLIASSLISLLALSACHSSGPSRWVNQTDSRQIMEFQIHESRSYLDKIHRTIMGAHIGGTYVVKDGDQVIDEGKVSIEAPGYVLKSRQGTTQRLQLAESGALKSENGATWVAEVGSKVVVQKKELKAW
jgi:hypothetical protein